MKHDDVHAHLKMSTATISFDCIRCSGTYESTDKTLYSLQPMVTNSGDRIGGNP